MEPLKETEERLGALCQEVRWRTRLNQVLRRATPATAGSLSLIALGLAADGLLLVSEPVAPWCSLGAVLLWLVAVSHAWMKSLSDVSACQRLDQQGDLEGRLANARAFLSRDQGPLSPMESAAVRDAARAAVDAEPQAVAPLRRPPLSWTLACAFALFLMSLTVTRSVGETEAAGLRSLAIPRTPAFRVQVQAPHDLLQLKVDARESEQAASRAGDSQVRQWLEALNQLIEDVASGRLSAERAHGRIAALERAQEAWESATGDGAKVEEHLRSAGSRTSRPTKHLKATVEALRAAQWEEGAQALEASSRAASESLSERERRRLSQGLRSLADRLESERQRAERTARKERRRLQKKREKEGRLSRKDRRRLDRQKRSLEKLERRRTEQGEMERTLERLQREMDEAARASRRGQKMDPELSKALQRAADAMRRMGQISRGRRQMRVSRMRLKDLRELLRRAAQGQGQEGRDGSEGKEGDKGEDGRSRFMRLALGGKQGKQQQGGGEGSSSGLELSPGAGRGAARVEMGGGAQGGETVADGVAESPGSEAGEGVDSQLYGEAERADAQARSSHVSGREGQGPSQSRVVLSAARRGFVNARYKAVHQDYSQVEEEAMERQHIPAGRRQYVREYFDLIRPR